MKKKLSLLLAMVMAIACLSLPALAEEAAAEDKPVTEIFIIPAEGEQIELGYINGTPILEVDGLKFKDLNDNGELDVYEDWREDIDARVADLYSQMTLKERSMMLYQVCTCGDNSGVVYNADSLYEQNCPYGESGAYSMWYYINVYGIHTYLDNSNGTPQEQVWAHNEIQAIAEATRLGIPIILTSDRQYNAWGGMIDTPHDAFGTAGNVELAQKLWEQYSKETRALGYHVVFHPYGVELGSWNGEDPEYLAKMTEAEVTAIQEGGMQACTKHFIARGGDADYAGANEVTQTVDNWMVAWKAAIEAGTKWIMTNGYNKGLANDVNVDFDKQTMSYLRDELGFDGIVLTDWGAMGNDMARGTTVDGVVLDDMTLAERYAFAINNGVDQMGAPGAGDEEATLAAGGPGLLSVDSVMHAVEQGLITEERLQEASCRVLKCMFELGLFDNPYSDADEVLAMSASAEYLAEPWEITDTESLMAARNPETVELERQLQAESAVLVKNDDDLLPLSEGLNLYIGSTAAESTLAALKEAFGAYATVVDDMEQADVVIADCTQMNDAAELIIEDAKYYEKTLVIVANNIDPDTYMMESADAVLFMNFSRPADHGSGEGGFITTTEPQVYAEILYGVREPAGMIVKEIARDSAMDEAQWKDLAGDQGANQWVRMMLLAEMKTNENNTTPNNWGDPLLCYQYGMRYGEDAEFVYDTLVLPRVSKEVTTESNGSTSTSYESVVECKAGEPFELYTLLWNNGADGVTTVQVKDGEEVIAEKIMAVNGGSWRVVEIEITLDTPGEHTITVGDLTKTINVAE